MPAGDATIEFVEMQGMQTDPTPGSIVTTADGSSYVFAIDGGWHQLLMRNRDSMSIAEMSRMLAADTRAVWTNTTARTLSEYHRLPFVEPVPQMEMFEA